MLLPTNSSAGKSSRTKSSLMPRELLWKMMENSQALPGCFTLTAIPSSQLLSKACIYVFLFFWLLHWRETLHQHNLYHHQHHMFKKCEVLLSVCFHLAHLSVCNSSYSIEVHSVNLLAGHSSSESGWGTGEGGWEGKEMCTQSGLSHQLTIARLRVLTPWETLGESSSVSFNFLIWPMGIKVPVLSASLGV